MLKQLTTFTVLATTVLLTGCMHRGPSPLSEPIVDRRGVNLTAYEADLADCKRYGEEVGVPRKVFVGAVGGAVVGGLIGAVVGNHETAERNAGVGAVVGGTREGVSGLHERNRVIRNCLRNRGYKVLN